MQDEINVQVGKFLKNIKRAGQNRRAERKFSGKLINVQGEIFWQINDNPKKNKTATLKLAILL